MSDKEDKLWEKFATNARSYKVIDFPRYDDKGVSIGKICIRTLFISEIKQLDSAVADEVDHIFQKDTKTFSENSIVMAERYKDRESNVRAEHFLQFVIVHPDNKEKLVFPTPMHVGKALSLEEAKHIMAQYTMLQEGRPQYTIKSEERFTEWMDVLSKSAEEDQLSFLGRLDQETLTIFSVFMVSQWYNFQSLNSSLITRLSELEKSSNSNNKDSSL